MTGIEMRKEAADYLTTQLEERKNAGITKVPMFDERDVLQAYSAGLLNGLRRHSHDYLVKTAELKEKLKTAYRKGMRHMAKALKDYDRTDGAWTDYFEHTVDKVLQKEQLDFEEYGTLADQLTKAKEIIKDLCGMVRELNKPNVQLTNVDYSLSEAEQFINEVEK